MSYDLAVNKPSTLGDCPVQETLRQRLERQVAVHKARLADAEIALKLLDANPTLEDFHNAITKVGY